MPPPVDRSHCEPGVRQASLTAGVGVPQQVQPPPDAIVAQTAGVMRQIAESALPLDADTTPLMPKSITVAKRADNQRRTNDSLRIKGRRM